MPVLAANINVSSGSEAEVQTRTAQEKELDCGIPITEGIVTEWPRQTFRAFAAIGWLGERSE